MARDLLTYCYKGRTICVRRHWNKTVLLIDGSAADTWRGVVEVFYTLRAKIGEDEIVAELTPRPVGGVMVLRINGEEVENGYKA